MIVSTRWTSNPQLFRVIGSMNNLEKLSVLNILELKHTNIEDLALMFRSCTKLTELRLSLLKDQ